MRHTAITMVILLACAGLAQAGVRAGLSGDSVVDFITTMDMPFMAVGNAGNTGEWSGESYGIPHPGPAETWGSGPDRICGAVDYAFSVGKFEVTAGQYSEFLNAVAATDTYALYSTDMWEHERGSKIQRSGADGSYTYSVTADREDRAVGFISWGDCARFANWMTNGMPTGSQDLTTTEDGSYFMNGGTVAPRKSPQDGGRYYIPSEDEWYKAAYHKNNGATGDYYIFPTSTDTIPSNVLVDPDPGNNANYTYPGPVSAPYWRAEAGEFENTMSPYGAFDMGGNVMEWTESIVLGSWRVLRGGAVMLNWGMNAAYRTTADPVDQGSLLGFRLTMVAGPGDLDGDGDIDADDIDLMGDCIRTTVPPTVATYDLTADGTTSGTDGVVNILDLDFLVRFLVEAGAGNGTEYGDFNLDGLIDTTDLTRLATYYGPGAKWSEGNANRNIDLLTDTTDLTILGTYYGQGPLDPDVVPEPMSLSLLALGACLPLFRRKRR